MSTARIVTRRPLSLLACLFVASVVLTSGGCKSTKPNGYSTPEHAQARCTESHSADGACAPAEPAEE